MPSECSHLPTWKELTFCDPMKGDKDNLSRRRPCGEWVSAAGKSAQWAARAVDARGRWSIGRPAMLACPIAGFTYPMRTQAFSRLVISLAPLVATVVPTLTGGEGIAHCVGRAYNDPIQHGEFYRNGIGFRRLAIAQEGRFQRPKKRRAGPGWPAPSATNQPSRRAAVHSGQPPTNMKPHAITEGIDYYQRPGEPRVYRDYVTARRSLWTLADRFISHPVGEHQRPRFMGREPVRVGDRI